MAETQYSPNQATSRRSKAPVFVLGCPRSGTTVLYHMLLSAGRFAIYRSESNVFNLLVPRFGGLRRPRERQELMDVWLRSKLFRVSGLDGRLIRAKILEECHNGGDFLRIVMEEVARNQEAERWADCTPDHLLYLAAIKRQIPNALIVHIIRDGRDVALSYVKQKWAHPLPWDRSRELAVAALYWEWVVRRGRKAGRKLGSDYIEVRFEQLVEKPREVLSLLGDFIAQPLDYEQILQRGIGSVSQPNSSFMEGSGENGRNFNPVGRWKEKLNAQQMAQMDALIGPLLKNLGYPISGHPRRRVDHVDSVRLRGTYFPLFGLKLWMKKNTPLGRRLVTLGPLEIQP